VPPATLTSIWHVESTPSWPPKPDAGTLEQVAKLGGEIRASRKRRGMTQKELGDRVGLSQSAVSEVETGNGSGYSLNAWQEVFLALGRPLIIDARRDPAADPFDAGHLAIQELVLRLATAARFVGTFELPVRPGLSRHSVDIFLRDDRRRLMVVCEAWNSFGDIGAASRSFSWKLAQAEEVAGGLEDEYWVGGCWIVRATVANRSLIGRYPSIFASRFPGSSQSWASALTDGAQPPRHPD